MDQPVYTTKLINAQFFYSDHRPTYKPSFLQNQMNQPDFRGVVQGLDDEPCVQCIGRADRAERKRRPSGRLLRAQCHR